MVRIEGEEIRRTVNDSQTSNDQEDKAFNSYYRNQNQNPNRK
jgi:hypothetical protein